MTHVARLKLRKNDTKMRLNAKILRKRCIKLIEVKY